MKTITVRSKPYPNAATARQRLEQAIDLLLIAAIAAGLTVSLLFLLTI